MSGRGLSALRAELLAIRPAHGRRRVAIRAAVSMLGALLVLDAFGELPWAVYATFGAFAATYGGSARWGGRWRLQTAVAFVLVAAVTSGALVGLSEHRRWLVIPIAAAWAVVGAALSDRFRWQPPGPMFVVFAVAAAAAVPSTTREVIAAATVAATTAAFTVSLGVVEVLLARTREARPEPGWLPPPGRRRTVHALRCGIAVALAGAVANLTGIGHPYWAMVAAVVPLAIPGLSAQLVRGVHRVAGTLVGIAVAAVLLVLDLPVLVVIVVAATLQGLTELVIVRNYALAMVFVTPLALMLVQLAVPQPVSTLLRDRVAETLIGAAVGVAVAVTTRARTP